MDLKLVSLLAGLIVIGMSLPGIFVPRESRIAKGVIVQFIFGAALVIAFFFMGGTVSF